MRKVFSFILSWVPLVTLFMGMLLFMPYYAADLNGTGIDMMDQTNLFVALVLIFIAVISVYAVMIWFMVKAYKDPSISKGMKVVWIAMLYTLNVFVFPIYWFAYIRKE